MMVGGSALAVSEAPRQSWQIYRVYCSRLLFKFQMDARAVLMCLALAAALLTEVRSAPKDKACTENDKPCKDNGECCGGCCQENKCVLYSDSCVSATNPCYLHDCPPNKVCYLLQVECLQSPCLPIPACKADDSDYN